jgi:A/G-specific adenine glycosylase
VPVAVTPQAREAILGWFDARGRSFPFRGIADPWAILVAETMAQQTQIGRATGKWTSFMTRFPTVEALAAGSPADVLREWRGLGYNRRALNLWRAARVVVDRHGGRVPDDIQALRRLPGVGPYTARAVAALAFGQPVGPVDTNVRRVLGRMVGGAAGLPAAHLQVVADAAVPLDRPADWTHALMDVGATFCRPTRPDCGACPAARWCAFAANGTAPPVAVRRPATSGAPDFRTTSRWLRGQLLDRFRDADGDGWVVVSERLEDHDAAAVERALAALERDGLVERHETHRRLARLPIA